MTFFTLIRRNIVRRKMRLFLSVLAIGVAFLLFGLMSAVRQNFALGQTSENSTRLVVSNRVGDLNALPVSYVDEVRRTRGVLAASFRTFVPSYFQNQTNVFLSLAVDPETYLELYPDYVISTTDKNDFVSDRSSIIVGKRLADRFGWKKGDIVPIFQRLSISGLGGVTRPMRIAGIFTGSSFEVGTGLALLHYSAFNELRTLNKDMVGSIVVRTSSTAANDGVIREIDAHFENSAFESATMTEEAFSRALVAQIGNISLITTLVTTAGFFVILLVIGGAMSSSIRERGREIGIMRLLGFMPAKVFSLVITEGVIVSVLGGVAGIVLADIIIKLIRTVDLATFGRLALTSSSLMAAIGLMVLFGVIATILPALKAVRIDVTEALGRR